MGQAVAVQGNVVTVERKVDASPEAIFDLLADPARHREIDGSGTVKESKASPRRLSQGATFGMSMRMGLPYSMVNEVVEFEENRRIAWQPRMSGRLGRIVGGRVWRYELVPVEGGTLVRESWDLSQDPLRFLLRRGPTPRQTKENMTRTLDRIAELLGAS